MIYTHVLNRVCMKYSEVTKGNHYLRLHQISRSKPAFDSSLAGARYFERAAPKVKFKGTDVGVLCAREIFTRLFDVGKLLKGMVARDGIEPPTPAFSEPL